MIKFFFGKASARELRIIRWRYVAIIVATAIVMIAVLYELNVLALIVGVVTIFLVWASVPYQYFIRYRDVENERKSALLEKNAK